VVSLLALQAEARGLRVLVVDSDESNSSLYRMLGFERPPVPLMELLGGKRKLKEKMRGPEVLRQERITLEDIPSPYLVQNRGILLLAIGKILQSLEGCACPMGVLSREFLKKLRLGENEIALVDMEAGIEHFGRGIDASIDGVLLVVEPSFESITAAERIRTLAVGMNKHLWAVLNKIPSQELEARVTAELQHRAIASAGTIPNDAQLFAACLEGHALDGRGDAFQAAGTVLDLLLASR
jgi:CO dehydrogenase maturation factor